MGRYTHLTIEEREDIMCLRREGAGVGRIAREIGRDKSTVSRELRRNACRAGSDRPFYRASTAQRRYEERRLGCRRPRLLDDPSLRSLVQRKILEDRWSPEQVAGRIGLEAGGRAVSAATIYRAVNARELDTPGMRGTRLCFVKQIFRKSSSNSFGSQHERSSDFTKGCGTYPSFLFPSMSESVTRRLSPLNSTSLPWWTILSTSADASLSSANTVPHFPNSMLVVSTIDWRS